MTEINSIPQPTIRKPRRRQPKKPPKPYPEFPLFAHATKRWAKKILGKLHYFGKWEDAKGALKKYLEQRDDLHAGRVPRIEEQEGSTLRDLCNRFLTYKRHLLDTRELSPQTFREYYAACERLLKVFGKHRLIADLHQEDFEKLRRHIAKQWGPIRLGNEIQRVRSIFKYSYDVELIEKPIRYGPGFKRPSKKVLRLARAKNGKRMFEREEILLMLLTASPPLEAMILLGVNAGLGNTDCASLEIRHLELDGGWLGFPRPKTGTDRRAKLWPETVAALREIIAKRARAKDEADTDLVFLTHRGGRWVKAVAEKQPDETLKVKCDDAISKEMKKILNKLGINGRRNFYSLRHSFETAGGEVRDQVAVNAIMGHVDDSMAATYRERISDERLEAVGEHVRRWLFGNKIAEERRFSKVETE
jgi:integrase